MFYNLLQTYIYCMKKKNHYFKNQNIRKNLKKCCNSILFFYDVSCLNVRLNFPKRKIQLDESKKLMIFLMEKFNFQCKIVLFQCKFLIFVLPIIYAYFFFQKDAAKHYEGCYKFMNNKVQENYNDFGNLAYTRTDNTIERCVTKCKSYSSSYSYMGVNA